MVDNENPSDLTRRRFLGTAAASTGAALTWSSMTGTAHAAVRPGSLWVSQARTEYAPNPLGLETAAPRLSWRLESPRRAQAQTAYQVIVASDERRLAAGQGDIWDSGRVRSRQSTQLPYGGPDLESFRRYHWKVRTWDGEGHPSPWSDPVWWETGPLNDEAWADAQWIGRRDTDASGTPPPAPLLRHEFTLDSPVANARLVISGLGYYESRINGQRVGNHVLDPGHTDYQDSVLYVIHDVTDLVTEGANAIGVQLGRGWYGVSTGNSWNWDTAPWHADPALRALLLVTHADGSTTTVTTDESWTTMAGPTRFDDVYVGETYDARRVQNGWDRAGFDAAGWDPAVRAPAPEGTLRAQAHEPVRLVEDIAPVAITEPTPGVYVLDLGVQLAGWARLRVSGGAGTEVEMYYGERLDDEGLVTIPSYTDFHDVSQGQTDRYILAGDGEEVWEPSFTYKGFRYVQVTGLPAAPDATTVTGRRIHNDVSSVGHFACAEPLLERIRDNTRRALMNNHHHAPTDTPVYEKNGWTGDAQLTATTAMYEYDMARFHTKWLADFTDAQLADGELPTIVPTSGWSYEGSPGWPAVHGPTPAWDAALILIPWYMYEFYGDTRLLERHYDGMRRYFDWLASYAKNHLLDVGLGDWLPPGGTPPEGPMLSSTAHSFLFARRIADVAEVLGDRGAAADYRRRAATIRGAFNEAFFVADEGWYRSIGYDGYRQTPNILPLAFGLVPDGREGDVAGRLVADIEQRDGHLDTGIVGTRYLLPVLCEQGYVDVAYRVATQRTYPSWGYWIELGRTALQEHWEADTRSLDHHMFGSIGHWLHADLAGISPAEPGWSAVRVRPRVPAALDHAEASTETMRGPVHSAWRVDGRGDLTLDVEVPVNATAEVSVPARRRDAVRATPPASSPFVEFVRMDDGTNGTDNTDGSYAVYAIASGAYTFTSMAFRDSTW